jgi:hypothetical protein
MEHRDEALRSATRCGEMLAEVAEQQGEMFGDFISKKLPEISKHHVVGLIKLSRNAGIASRQALLQLADKAEKVERDENKKLRVESHIIFVNKICQWFLKRTKNEPLEDWPESARENLKRELEPLVNIYRSLSVPAPDKESFR